MTFSIATWNVNSLRVRLPHVLQWIEANNPSVLALQETKVTDELFPVAEIEALGYSVIYTGQPTYNGVAILSRKPPEQVVTALPHWNDSQCRFLAATIDQVHVVNVYVPNGASVDSDKYQYKLTWLEHLRQYLQTALTVHKRLVVLGDFNIAPEDNDVYDPVAWAGKVLCSEPEREALQSLLALGLKDNFRLFSQPEETYSWWNYRTFAFRGNRGLRIDLILSSQAFAEHCQSCRVDIEPRQWERPSDHAPVCAYFD